MEGFNADFYQLPHEIVREICELLSLKDLAKLDTAMCCHSLRQSLQAIQQSLKASDNGCYDSSFTRSILWSLRRSIPFKRLYVGPSNVTLFLSDPKALPNIPNAQEIVFSYGIDYNQPVESAIWPAKAALLFNVLSDRQKLFLELSCYQPDVLEAFYSCTNVTDKNCSVRNVADLGYFMQDERVFPFLFSIGEIAQQRDTVCPTFNLPLNNDILFPKLEELVLPWEAPIPWLRWLLSRSPHLKKIRIGGWENLAVLTSNEDKKCEGGMVCLRELVVMGEFSAASQHHDASNALLSIARCTACSTLESLRIYLSGSIVNSENILSLATLKGLKYLSLSNLYCSDDDLLFVLRQLSNVNILFLNYCGNRELMSLGRKSAFFRALFTELDFQELDVTFNLPQDLLNEQTLSESFPTSCNIAAKTTSLSVNCPFMYYQAAQLEGIALSFTQMIASGRFANLTRLHTSHMLLQHHHFEVIRDACPKLESIFCWSKDSCTSIVDRFPQGWKHLRNITHVGAGVSETGLRQMIASSPFLRIVQVKLQVQKGNVLQAIKMDFPRIKFLFQ